MGLFRSVIFTLILFWSLALYGQNTKSYISFESGVTMPYDLFANKIMGGYSGFANNGFHVNLQKGSYSRYFFYNLFAGYNIMSFDNKSLEDDYNKNAGLINEIKVTTTGNYHLFQGLLRFGIKTPEIKKKIAIFANVGTGYARASIPKHQAYLAEYGYLRNTKPASGGTVLFTTGLMAYYNIDPFSAFSISFNRSSANFIFKSLGSIDFQIYELSIGYIIQLGNKNEK